MFEDFEFSSKRSTEKLQHLRKFATKQTLGNGSKMIEREQKALDSFSDRMKLGGIKLPRGCFRLEILKDRKVFRIKILKITKGDLLSLGKIALAGLIEDSPLSEFSLRAESRDEVILMPPKLRFEIKKHANVDSNSRLGGSLA